MSWQLWRQTLRVAGHVPKMSVICVQFVPNLSPGDKFGINLGQIGDTLGGTQWCHDDVTRMTPTSVTAFMHFWRPGVAKESPQNRLLNTFGQHVEAQKHCSRLHGSIFFEVWGVSHSLDTIMWCPLTKWVSSESQVSQVSTLFDQVSLKWVLKWVPKFLASEYQVSAQVRAMGTNWSLIGDMACDPQSLPP